MPPFRRELTREIFFWVFLRLADRQTTSREKKKKKKKEGRLQVKMPIQNNTDFYRDRDTCLKQVLTSLTIKWETGRQQILPATRTNEFLKTNSHFTVLSNWKHLSSLTPKKQWCHIFFLQTLTGRILYLLEQWDCSLLYACIFYDCIIEEMRLLWMEFVKQKV